MAEDQDFYKQAFDYSWNWFQFHAKQRMYLVNFWALISTFMVGGWATLVAKDDHAVAIGIALFGIVTTLTFKLLDRRTEILVQSGKNALLKLEENLAKLNDIDELRIACNADCKQPNVRRIGTIIPAFYCITMAAWAVAGTYSLAAVTGLKIVFC